MSIQVITLLVLVLSIFIGFKLNVNTGIIGIAFAFIVGMAIGMPAKNILAGWPTSLFVILMAMTLLFSIAKVNGTLDLIAKKVANLSKGNTKLLPILFFIMCTVIAALGSGPIVAPALMLPLALEVAKNEDIPDLLMATMVIAGSLAGGLSPLTPSGIIANSLSAKQGLDTTYTIFISMFLTGCFLGVIYYLLLGGLKLQRSTVAKAVELYVPFNSQQKITILVILLVIIGILFFKLDIALTAFAGSAILLSLKVANQNQAFQGIPWSTLILVAGVGILVNVVSVAGGIATLSKFLSTIMTPTTAASIMAAMGGLMSFVSSASGVVMPTLIPAVPGIVENMNNTVSASSLISGIVVGAHVVTVSPLSTLGALAVAAATERTEKEKFFTQLLMVGLAGLPLAFILGLLGVYR